jgi:hypothetical protein
VNLSPKECLIAGRGPQTFKKKQKEQLRKEKQEEKAARREERKRTGGTSPLDEEIPLLDAPLRVDWIDDDEELSIEAPSPFKKV